MDSGGQAIAESNCRLGLASVASNVQCRFRKRAALSAQKTVQFVSVCVISKLTDLQRTAWFGKAGVCKLDAFQAPCIRKILRMTPFIWKSRSNADVLRNAKMLPCKYVNLSDLTRRCCRPPTPGLQTCANLPQKWLGQIAPWLMASLCPYHVFSMR